MTYLFTYGTLKRAFANPFAQKLHAFSTYLGEGYFLGKLYRIDWYPGAVSEPQSHEKVYGEIFRIDDPGILKKLDEYEDVLEDEVASLYVRRKIPIIVANEKPVLCWTYLYNQPVNDLEIIKSGIFRN